MQRSASLPFLSDKDLLNHKEYVEVLLQAECTVISYRFDSTRLSVTRCSKPMAQTPPPFDMDMTGNDFILSLTPALSFEKTNYEISWILLAHQL